MKLFLTATIVLLPSLAIAGSRPAVEPFYSYDSRLGQHCQRLMEQITNTVLRARDGTEGNFLNEVLMRHYRQDGC
jgi:hypothetical protein